jgi:branched-chain amino acid transport system substrate-binding protein
VKRFVLATVMAIGCLGVAACGGSGSDGGSSSGGEYHLGAMADLTGPSAQVGRTMMAGVKASIDGVNARGGVNGRTIALETRDDANAQATAVSGIRALLGQDDLIGVVGVNSTFVASTLAPFMEKSETALISSSYPPELLEPARTGVYMALAQQDTQGAAQVHFAAQLAARGKLPRSPRIALLRFDSPGSEAWADGASEQAKDDGLEVVTDQAYALGAKDVSSQAIRIASTGADVILLYILPSEASMVQNAIDNAGVSKDVPMIGYFAASSKEFMEQMHGRPYYGLADYNYTAGSPLSKQVTEDAKRAGADPDAGLFLEGYAFGLIAEEALKKCGADCDRAGFVDALSSLRTDLGGFAFGEFGFSKDHRAGVGSVAFVKLDGDKVVQMGDPVPADAQ